MYFVSHGLAAVRYVEIRDPMVCSCRQSFRATCTLPQFYPTLYFIYLNPLYLLTGNTCVHHRVKALRVSELNRPPYRWDPGVPKEVLGRHTCISWMITFESLISDRTPHLQSTPIYSVPIVVNYNHINLASLQLKMLTPARV